MIRWGHSILIPVLGEFPYLGDGEHRATFGFSRGKPFVQIFFRLEEEHVHSGEGKVVIPFPKWDEEMYERFRRILDLLIGHA